MHPTFHGKHRKETGNRGHYRRLGRCGARHRSRIRAPWSMDRADCARSGRPRRSAARGGGRRRPSFGAVRGRRRCRGHGSRGRSRGARTGADRHLGQRRDDVGLRPHQRDDRRGISPRDGGDVSRLCVRHAGGTETHAAAGSRDHRACGVGAGVPEHSAAGGLLRCKTRGPGVPRSAAHGAAARPQQGADDHGADAGAEHAAVRLGAKQAAAQSAAGAADFSA